MEHGELPDAGNGPTWAARMRCFRLVPGMQGRHCRWSTGALAAGSMCVGLVGAGLIITSRRRMPADHTSSPADEQDAQEKQPRAADEERVRQWLFAHDGLDHHAFALDPAVAAAACDPPHVLAGTDACGELALLRVSPRARLAAVDRVFEGLSIEAEAPTLQPMPVLHAQLQPRSRLQSGRCSGNARTAPASELGLLGPGRLPTVQSAAAVSHEADFASAHALASLAACEQAGAAGRRFGSKMPPAPRATCSHVYRRRLRESTHIRRFQPRDGMPMICVQLHGLPPRTRDRLFPNGSKPGTPRDREMRNVKMTPRTLFLAAVLGGAALCGCTSQAPPRGQGMPPAEKLQSVEGSDTRSPDGSDTRDDETRPSEGAGI